MTAGMAKALGVTPDYVLHEMTWANMALYSAALPTYGGTRDKAKGQEVIKADDPRNNERVRRLIETFE